MDVSKRRFLSGNRGTEIRLPWIISESHFTTHCTRCHACVDACPERIIITASGGFPRLEFAERGCTFCGECLQACPEPLFRPRSEAAFAHRMSISSDCLPMRGIECRSCGEVCEVQAIRFDFGAARMAVPVVVNELCNGCGECVGVCPVQAFSVRPESYE